VSARQPRAGQRAEWAVRENLERDGYVVWRSGGSLTCADLLAAKPGEWLLVQVKAGDARLEHEWFNELWTISDMLSAGGSGGAWGRVLAIIADFPVKVGRTRPMRLRRITGAHEFGKRLWPVESFRTDDVEVA